jgi:hypothetical protein
MNAVAIKLVKCSLELEGVYQVREKGDSGYSDIY